MRYGPRWFMGVGPLVAAVALVPIARLEPHFTYWLDLAPRLLLFAVGLSMIVAPLTSTVLADAGERDVGIASGFNNAVARVAGLLGIAVVGAAAAGATTSSTFRVTAPRCGSPSRSSRRAARSASPGSGTSRERRRRDRLRPRDEALRRARRGGTRRPLARDPGRHVLRARRPVRRRKDDGAEDGQPARPVRLRRHPHRRPQRPRHPGRRAAARDRLRHPADRPLPAHERRRQRRHSAAPARLAEGAGSARAASSCSSSSGSRPPTRSATRPSSPAASGSASVSPARSRPTRRCC